MQSDPSRTDRPQPSLSYRLPYLHPSLWSPSLHYPTLPLSTPLYSSLPLSTLLYPTLPHSTPLNRTLPYISSPSLSRSPGELPPGGCDCNLAHTASWAAGEAVALCPSLPCMAPGQIDAVSASRLGLSNPPASLWVNSGPVPVLSLCLTLGAGLLPWKRSYWSGVSFQVRASYSAELPAVLVSVPFRAQE